ncbi:MAG: serine/threonine protein kinase [Clostridiales bacterium]|nr:serine/threonine protein kinase [Clostridiales bacterium]
MLEIGSLVDGKYKVLNIIGQGGMSVVYLAMNEKANKQWAIKEVRKDGIKNFELVKQGLIVETNMLKKLSHPNLPSIIDVIDQDGTFLIVMDYIQGNPLDKTLEEEGAQPQELVIEWAKQICDVLEYLHTRTPPIIYRDMKPANLMLKPDGTITLIDFGTAREFKHQNHADTTCLGTQGYAAPEQFGGIGQTDARTDIYCLGTTLYHLVTGHNPSEPPYEMYPIGYWNSSLSEGLEKIIEKCTQRNPDDRYQSCAELLYALEHFEEIDDAYRKKQKKRLAIFSVTFLLTLLFLTTSVLAHLGAQKAKIADYNSKIELAEKTTDEKAKEELYIEAININPSDKTAYLGLIKDYLEDTNFSLDEERQIELLRISNASNSNKKLMDHLKSNPDDYAEVCFELGTAYWYYYEKEESRQTSAVVWFTEVVQYEKNNQMNKNRAMIFRDIGTFHKDIRRLQDEGNDAGHYKSYWDNLKRLKEVNDERPDREAITVRLYKEIVSQTYNYCKYYREDGIEKGEIISMLDNIETHLIKMNSTQERIKQEIQDLLPLIKDTTAIVNATYMSE